MRKGAAAVAVSQGPDAGHVCLQLIIDNDIAVLVGRNPGAVETEVVGVRSTAYRQKNMSA
jgi:hypothetical protein